ncbi:MBL fold metallo-hydrolase [Amycolatopsis sp. H20-H5]|uniref:MBL fold metallo-hydrolase n=1 Tax=Amycolatopsis sp. H20-H5 TaxID=3046309 RepID=UPI002DBA3D64|nr:MBL fold metallo-hydrolase [Amycolatopsis sp. H20-H5]MEC3976732.1 MBL fold metallo-hydrolase [Amycolatopsis sp. H20-H5]
MLVVGFPAGPLQANCYLLALAAGGECVVVDPGQDALEPLEAALREHRLTPAAVLATHGHPDHVASAAALEAGHGTPLRLHRSDTSWANGETIPLDEGVLSLAGLEITVDHTPGHTPGSVVFRLTTPEGGRLVLTGDTLFAGSIGRALGTEEELDKSLRAKLMALPDDTVVLPGHGPATTIGQERASNPFLAGAAS